MASQRQQEQKFLIDNGYQWIVDLWEQNARNCTDPTYSRFRQLTEAFCWNASPEGESFWCKVHDACCFRNVVYLTRASIYPLCTLRTRWNLNKYASRLR